MMRSPGSRIGVLTPDELDQLVKRSVIAPKYSQTIDRESAHEILLKKMEAVREDQAAAEEDESSNREKSAPKEKSLLEQAVNSSVGRTVVRELTRG